MYTDIKSIEILYALALYNAKVTCYINMEINIIEKLFNELPTEESPANDGLLNGNGDGEHPEPPTINESGASTSDNNELLERIAKLEELISNMTKEENGNNIQA